MFFLPYKCSSHFHLNSMRNEAEVNQSFKFVFCAVEKETTAMQACYLWKFYKIQVTVHVHIYLNAFLNSIQSHGQRTECRYNATLTFISHYIMS